MGTAASKNETDVVNFTPKTQNTNSKSVKPPHKSPRNKIPIAVDDSRDPSNGSMKRGRKSGSRTDTVTSSQEARTGSTQQLNGQQQPLREKGSGSQASNRTGTTASSSAAQEAGTMAGPPVTSSVQEISTNVLPNHVPDEEVKVNLAMADLMAYLQVVANNSTNLPLTIRDDPELGRTVSTLTADEYARKAAAFIPSDVRIIGGTFLKYGRVWDLPTSEEFAPADGAQEPGRSHGGACCNSLLKVLYDTESDAADVMAQSQYVNPDNLFDDDDTTLDGSKAGQSAAGQTDSFDVSLGELTSASTITWADLLRKMKLEMQSIGFAQVPTVSSSRKFDLNKPFTLSPPGFDPTKNKKRSLLIGCNYGSLPGAELKASHDDIRSVKDFIVNVHGFPESKGLMTVLLDDGDHKPPTHTNIIEAFKVLSEQSLPGDSVFIQFSGHGGRVLDSAVDAEAESYDECIVPSDFHSVGIIRDTLFFKTLLAPMRYGVTVTCVIDCCDTGTIVDLPYSWTTLNDRPDALAKMSLNDDFSFVRFLKVVKSLYEMSTFTQLGNTVKSSLNEKATAPPPAPVRAAGDEEDTLPDDDTLGVGSLVTVDENEAAPAAAKGGTNSLMTTLAACYSPNAQTTSPKRTLKTTGSDVSEGATKAGKTVGEETVQTQGTVASVFQQVMNCTLTHQGEESDDETFNQAMTQDDDDEQTMGDNTADDQTYDQTLSEDGTYETYTDLEEESAPQRSRGRR